nr:B-cell receptor-associated protein 29 [Pogona vitticeps]XP_020668745.1 B-cell receptor-associated protein 29 [Pogona vitticeps]XP_020668746.1 B-cell receptor-associated protein 29 [Pogona vitticeps]XP_020668747.1 B-cell receptor-associated protein 29 [Pogona vitticeps]XP_020668748.1 B-cell receptor-associated protein 29 [Pogona vitticeps]
MTFQWTAVAAFLYAEIVILLLLCIPIISPQRWQKVFGIPIWNKITNYWNKAFLTIIVLLIVLFLDAVREVRKYSNIHLSEKTTHASPNAFDHIQMKLFRSQRNLYISGFSLFLWLVLRRMISLITLLAREMGAQAALEMQIADTSEVAKKYLEENEKLQQTLKEKTNCDSADMADATSVKLKQEVEDLKEELNKKTSALKKSTNEMTAVKKKCEDLRKEYDHLTKEHKRMLGCASEKHNKKTL